jgi:hypothetical protein
MVGQRWSEIGKGIVGGLFVSVLFPLDCAEVVPSAAFFLTSTTSRARRNTRYCVLGEFPETFAVLIGSRCWQPVFRNPG